jgi:hypothetical protein
MTRAADLPLVSKPVIIILQPRLENIFAKGFEFEVKIFGNDMGVVSYTIPYKLGLGCVRSPFKLFPPGEVTVQIMPLHISTAKGDKHC